jgi:hypothetical protein
MREAILNSDELVEYLSHGVWVSVRAPEERIPIRLGINQIRYVFRWLSFSDKLAHPNHCRLGAAKINLRQSVETNQLFN